jgi:hypothetical protein
VAAAHDHANKYVLKAARSLFSPSLDGERSLSMAREGTNPEKKHVSHHEAFHFPVQDVDTQSLLPEEPEENALFPSEALAASVELRPSPSPFKITHLHR